MQDCVIAGEHATTIAIDRQMHCLSDQVYRERRCRCMPDDIVRVGLYRFNGQQRATVPADDPGIGWLTTAAGVETSAIESSRVIPDGDDDGVGLGAVIVVEVEPCG